MTPEFFRARRSGCSRQWSCTCGSCPCLAGCRGRMRRLHAQQRTVCISRKMNHDLYNLYGRLWKWCNCCSHHDEDIDLQFQLN
jgi:hypothetical protein